MIWFNTILGVMYRDFPSLLEYLEKTTWLFLRCEEDKMSNESHRRFEMCDFDRIVFNCPEIFQQIPSSHLYPLNLSFRRQTVSSSPVVGSFGCWISIIKWIQLVFKDINRKIVICLHASTQISFESLKESNKRLSQLIHIRFYSV